MDGGIVGELVEMVQATAPMLWAIAQRQVVANAIRYAVWAGLCIPFTLVLVLAMRYCVRRDQQSTNTYHLWYMGTLFAGLGACVTLVVALCCFTSAIMHAVNPDYYAIKILLGLVR